MQWVWFFILSLYRLLGVDTEMWPRRCTSQLLSRPCSPDFGGFWFSQSHNLSIGKQALGSRVVVLVSCSRVLASRSCTGFCPWKGRASRGCLLAKWQGGAYIHWAHLVWCLSGDGERVLASQTQSASLFGAAEAGEALVPARCSTGAGRIRSRHSPL